MVDEIACIGRDPGLIKETLAQARRDVQQQIESLQVERTGLRNLLVESVSFDGHTSSLSITFRPSGLKTLAGELAGRKGDAA